MYFSLRMLLPWMRSLALVLLTSWGVGITLPTTHITYVSFVSGVASRRNSFTSCVPACCITYCVPLNGLCSALDPLSNQKMKSPCHVQRKGAVALRDTLTETGPDKMTEMCIHENCFCEKLLLCLHSHQVDWQQPTSVPMTASKHTPIWTITWPQQRKHDTQSLSVEDCLWRCCFVILYTHWNLAMWEHTTW